MDIEDFRAFCLSLAGARDAFPFAKAASEYDRDILVFYVLDKWFCFVNPVVRDFCCLRCPTESIAELQERYEGIGPGWHMNKKHWISVRFRSDVPDALLRELVGQSYRLALEHLSKRQRAELEAAENAMKI